MHQSENNLNDFSLWTNNFATLGKTKSFLLLLCVPYPNAIAFQAEAAQISNCRDYVSNWCTWIFSLFINTFSIRFNYTLILKNINFSSSLSQWLMIKKKIGLKIFLKLNFLTKWGVKIGNLFLSLPVCTYNIERMKAKTVSWKRRHKPRQRFAPPLSL